MFDCRLNQLPSPSHLHVFQLLFRVFRVFSGQLPPLVFFHPPRFASVPFRVITLTIVLMNLSFAHD